MDKKYKIIIGGFGLVLLFFIGIGSYHFYHLYKEVEDIKSELKDTNEDF